MDLPGRASRHVWRGATPCNSVRVASADRAVLQPHGDSGETELNPPNLDRSFSEAEREEVTASVLKAKRYTFIESGVTHPNFQEVFTEVTTEPQREKVGAALGSLLG